MYDCGFRFVGLIENKVLMLWGILYMEKLLEISENDLFVKVLVIYLEM